MSLHEIMEELVSVITPCYNCERFLPQTIESVIAQTYTNWEMLIIDDCSTDNSRETALQYAAKDARVKVFKMDKNGGTALARNKGIELSAGEYLAFLDSDDLWLPCKLEKQLLFMKLTGCDFCFTRYRHIDDEGKPAGLEARVLSELTYKKMLYHDFAGCLTVMYKQNKNSKIFIPKVGTSIEDYALFLAVLKHSKKAFGYPESLALYRVHSKSLSGRKLNKLKKVAYYFDVMLNVEHKNILSAVFYLLTNQAIKLFWKYERTNP